jgi:hypothetical protein
MDYDEYKKLGVTSKTTKQNFKMNIVADANNNYQFIKRLVMQ